MITSRILFSNMFLVCYSSCCMAIISGKLCRGKGVGRKMGFPTLNMPYDGKARGVFAAKVLLGKPGYWYKAAVHLGPRPTFNDDSSICEIFVLDWDGKLDDFTELKEGSEIKVQIVTRLRDIKKFQNIEDLKEQIAKDVESVKMHL